MSFLNFLNTNHTKVAVDPFTPSGASGGLSGTAPRGLFGTAPGGRVIDFQSPLGFVNFQQLADRIINGLIMLATPIVIIMVLWGAFLLITSAGNKEKVTQGRNTLLWATVGYGILLIAKGISSLVANLLGVI